MPLYREERDMIDLLLDDTEKLIADCGGEGGVTSPARRRFVDR